MNARHAYVVQTDDPASHHLRRKGCFFRNTQVACACGSNHHISVAIRIGGASHHNHLGIFVVYELGSIPFGKQRRNLVGFGAIDTRCHNTALAGRTKRLYDSGNLHGAFSGPVHHLGNALANAALRVYLGVA